jgi:sRNA-binding regulator protein Hfq
MTANEVRKEKATVEIVIDAVDKIKLGPFNFPTWTDAFEFARNTLAKYKVGDAVTDQERDFLVAALRLRGAKGLEKIGTGVHRIYIDTNSFGTCCFFLERTDGTTIDFSYIKCFKEHISQPTKPWQKFIGKESKCLGDEHTTKIEKQTLLPATPSEIVQETKETSNKEPEGFFSQLVGKKITVYFTGEGQHITGILVKYNAYEFIVKNTAKGQMLILKNNVTVIEKAEQNDEDWW